MSSDEPTVAVDGSTEPTSAEPADDKPAAKPSRAKKTKEPKAKKAPAPKKPRHRTPSSHPPYEEVILYTSDPIFILILLFLIFRSDSVWFYFVDD